MQKAYESGLVIQNKPGSVPALKRYLDEQEGTPVGDVWIDILPVQAQAAERLGYPNSKTGCTFGTNHQKPAVTLVTLFLTVLRLWNNDCRLRKRWAVRGSG